MKGQIKYMRKQNNITQEELSLVLFVSRETISNWERGFSEPTTDNLVLLSIFFNKPMSYFISEKYEILKEVHKE